jgi:glutamine cyclotransferase
MKKTIIAITLLTGFISSLENSKASVLYVTDNGAGVVGTYDSITGSAINSAFITGIGGPTGIAFDGNQLYVGHDNGYVGQYNLTTGAAVNSTLISGLNSVNGLAVLDNNLFYANWGNSTFGKFDLTTLNKIGSYSVSQYRAFGLAIYGDTLLAAGRSGIGQYNTSTGAQIKGIDSSGPVNGIAVAGNYLYAAYNTLGTIGRFNLADGTGSYNFITGLNTPRGVAIDGNNLFVSSGTSIAQYNATTGATINSSFISGLNIPVYIAIVPEPSTYALFGLGALALVVAYRRKAA